LKLSGTEDYVKRGKNYVVTFDRYKTVVIFSLSAAAVITDKWNNPSSVPDIPAEMLEVQAIRLHNQALSIIDKRVRILDSQIFWEEKTPMHVNISVKEKMRQPDYSYSWETPIHPVNISIRIHIADWANIYQFEGSTPVTGNFRNLVDAYGDIGSTVSLDSNEEIYPRPYAIENGKVSVSLISGISLFPSYKENNLDYYKLSDIILDSQGTNNLGNVAASIEAVAYINNKNNEKIEMSNNARQIQITHFFEVISAHKGYKTQLDIFEPEPLRSLLPTSGTFEKMKLQPGIILQLGPNDQIELRHIIAGEVWVIKAIADEVPEKTSMILSPTKEFSVYETIKDFKGFGWVAGVISGGIVFCVIPEKTTGFWAGATIGATVGIAVDHVKDWVLNKVYPTKIMWTRYEDEDTIIVFEVRYDQFKIYLIEGSASFTDLDGNKIHLSDGQMSKIDGLTHFSPPQTFSPESLPTEIASLIENLDSDINTPVTRAQGRVVHDHVLSKGVDDYGDPVGLASSFPVDEFVFSWVSFDGLEEGDVISWWFAGPNSIETVNEFFVEKSGEEVIYSWIDLNVYNSKQIVGPWEVVVFVNGEEIDSRYFDVERVKNGIPSFPSESVFLGLIVGLAIWWYRARTRISLKDSWDPIIRFIPNEFRKK